MRAAVYLRVSTDEQAQSGVSLAMQEAECRQRAAALGATSIQIYRDEGISGTRWERPGLQALLADLPRTDLLVVWAKDRLTRDVRHLFSIIDRVAENGVRLVALRESVDMESAEGKLSIGLMGVIAQYQPDKTSENVKAAMRRIAETGRLPAGCPYGYRRTPAKGIEPHPDQAPIVRDIFARIVAGNSVTSIARWLNEIGAPLKAGGLDWRTSTVRQILRHETHRGMIQWADLLLPGAHEAIVDSETWQAAQAILDARRATRGRPVRSLAPLLRCGLCGSIVTHRPMEGAATYSCRRLTRNRVHDYYQVAARKADAAIWRHTELLLSSNAIPDAVAAAAANARAARSQGGDIQRQIDELQRRRRVNLLALQAGAITAEDIVAMNAPLVREDERLQAMLAPSDLSPVLAELDALRRGGATKVLKRLQGLSVEWQVVALRGLYARIEILPGNALRFHTIADWTPPVDRQLPTYYAPSRGKGLGW